MYKITVLYESDINGVYVQEIETASDEFFKNLKYQRLLDKWSKRLCPKFNMDTYYYTPKDVDLFNFFIIDSINLSLDYQNKINKKDRNRTFNINVEMIES